MYRPTVLFKQSIIFCHGVYGFAPGPFVIIPYPEIQHCIHITDSSSINWSVDEMAITEGQSALKTGSLNFIQY